ncbi:MAG: hypothetical protein L6R38_007905 [Xanthoria sp. 2 TBL-2021]|nr:MAG: hypothetical protein L6R38_007905 [Xanthoria sp. 2 TBL-2021]
MWPTTDGRCFHGLAIRAEREAAPNAKVLADIFIDNELAICGGLDDLRIGDLSDTEEIASSQIMKRPQNQVALLHALYLRTRQQSTDWTETSMEHMYLENVGKFNDIKYVFKGYFNFAKEVNLQEKDQERYFDTHSDRLLKPITQSIRPDRSFELFATAP